MRVNIILYFLFVCVGKAALVPSLVPKTPYPKPQGGKIDVVDVSEGKKELERFGLMLRHFNPNFSEHINRPIIRVDFSPPVAASPQLHADVGLLIQSAITHVGVIQVVPWDFREASTVGAGQATPQVVTIPKKVQIVTLTSNDITDMPSFVALLFAKTNLVSAYLLERFSDTTRQLLSEYVTDPSKEFRVRRLLAIDLNYVIEGESIYESNRFSAVSVSFRDDTATFAKVVNDNSQTNKQFKLNRTAQMVFNRLLLEDAYPLHIPRDHTAVIPDFQHTAQWEVHPYLKRWSMTPIVISGSFTRYDERIDSQNRSAGASLYYDFAGSAPTPKALSADLGVEFENELTGLGLTLKAAENEGATIIPGCVVDATGVVAKAKRKQNLGFFFYGNGVNFAGQATRANGVHEVCIRMVDRSTLAILGKFYRLPYWRCIRNGQQDDSVIQLIKEYFNYGFEGAQEQRQIWQLREMKRMLELNNYRFPTSVTDIDRAINSKEISDASKTEMDLAIKDYCQKQRLDIGEPNALVYAQLHLTVPIPGFPGYDQNLANAKSPEAGVVVEFSGFPQAYKDILYKVLSDSSDVREVSEQAPLHGAETALRFKADMFFDDATRLAKHVESVWPKRKLDSREKCEAEVVNEKYLRVIYKIGRVPLQAK